MGVESQAWEQGGRTKAAASPVHDESPDPEQRSAAKHESTEEETQPEDIAPDEVDERG